MHVGSGVYGSLTVCVSHKKISISRSNNVCQCSQCVYVCACVCLRGVRVCVCVSLHVGIHYRAPEVFSFVNNSFGSFMSSLLNTH